ncbi:MAG TPA: hypothetical protein VGW38_11225 [Chloroflexota bacterium]|nr:hypothetical protein [Chloroflexota bacterium]
MIAEELAWAWARLALAGICVAVLIAARWQHERQLLNAPRTFIPRSTLTAGRGRTGARSIRPSGPLQLNHLSYPLYWLGLTTTAALAAQAIAVLVRHGLPSLH